MKALYAVYLVGALLALGGAYKLYKAFDDDAKACIDIQDLKEQQDCFSDLSAKAKPAGDALRAVTQ